MKNKLNVNLDLEGRHARRTFFSGWLCKGEIEALTDHAKQVTRFCLPLQQFMRFFLAGLNNLCYSDGTFCKE